MSKHCYAKVYLLGLSHCLCYEPEMCAELDKVNHNIFNFLPNKYAIMDQSSLRKCLPL